MIYIDNQIFHKAKLFKSKCDNISDTTIIAIIINREDTHEYFPIILLVGLS